RVRQHQGDHAGARDALRLALKSTREPRERLACVALLVTLLEPVAREERASLCDELERLLEHDDDPRLRFNLATALLQDAKGEPVRMLRAWRQGIRALPGLRAAEDIHGRQVLGSIARQHARAALGRWAPEGLGLARWLAEDHP